MQQPVMLWRLFVCLFSLGLWCLNPVHADTSDWVQVKRFQQLEEDAKQGKLQAMFEVGRKYERGSGTMRSMVKAAEWYEKAAAANHPGAKARLGILYVEGNGVKKDLNKAVRLLSEASEQNIASAQYQLASMYELGIGVAVDINQAISLYRKAAKGGYYQAEDKARRLAGGGATGGAGKASATADTLLKGSWQRLGRPVGYLPSSISHCSNNAGILKCISTAQERSTGREIIAYNTEATISEFSGNRFRIEYVNNVLEVEMKESNAAFDEGDEDEAATSSRVQAGRQETVHVLECTLDKPKALTCTKNKVRTLKFTS